MCRLSFQFKHFTQGSNRQLLTDYGKTVVAKNDKNICICIYIYEYIYIYIYIYIYMNI